MLKEVGKVLVSIILTAVAAGSFFWYFAKDGKILKFLDNSNYIQRAEPIAYINDINTGIKLKPNTKIHYKTPEVDVTVVTNGEGFTGRDYPVVTKNYRIAVMGDSFVEGYGVPDELRFNYAAEGMIYAKSKGKLKVEIMGFGVSGWGNVQQLGCIKEYVLKYKPNEIWLGFLPDNDFGDNTPLMNPPPTGPTFIYENEKSSKIVDITFGFNGPPDAVHAERLRRYGDLVDKTRPMWSGLLPYYWADERNPTWDLIEDHTFQTFRMIKELTDKHHIKLAILYRKTGYEFDEDDWKTIQNDAEKFWGKKIIMRQENGWKRFQKKVEGMGIEFINTLEIHTSTLSLPKEEWEPRKHADFADYISNKIIDRLSAPPK